MALPSLSGEFCAQLIAWSLHQGVAVPPPLEDAGFDSPGTVGHFIGGDV